MYHRVLLCILISREWVQRLTLTAIGSVTPITLKLDGYEDFHVMLTRNERVDAGAIVGGLFFWIPFLWTMQYNPSHTYEMVPLR